MAEPIIEMTVGFPGGLRVDADFGAYHVGTDQPVEQGGAGEAPTPFHLFLASIATCAGIYVLGFCRKRDLPVDNIRIVQRVYMNDYTHLAEEMELEIQVPPEFPAHYHSALVKAAEQCKVKKHLENPPEIKTFTKVREG